LWLFRPFAGSPPGSFAPGLFAPCAWLIRPPIEYTADSLLKLVSIYGKATGKCNVMSLINSYFN